MARGIALSVIRSMLKAEIGDYSGANTASDGELNVLLSNKQLWLAAEYDWPFLERRWNVVVNPNTQYVALPTVDDKNNTVALNLVRMPRVQCYYNQKYSPVDYGISDAEYNSMDFAIQQQSDPIRRWRLATNPDEATNPNVFEVWPVPVTQQTLRFTGQRVPLTLAVDADKADMEDMLLVYLVAADQLLRHKQADAGQMVQKAQRLLQNLRQNFPTRDRQRNLAEGSADLNEPRPGLKLVAIH